MMSKKITQQITLSFLSLFLAITITATGQQLKKVPAEQVGLSAKRLKRLTKTFDDYVKNKQLSGGVILVARKGKIAYFNAFGKSDIENNIPMKKNSMFRIASQTKALISLGIMILQEEGKLDINDALSKYIPAFKNTTVADTRKGRAYSIEKNRGTITLRHLLTHTSGIGYGWGTARELWKKANIQGWYFGDRKEPILNIVNRMAKLPFDAYPGDRFIYGYSTDILGALIEVVSKQPLDVFLKTKILKPLGMKDTHFYLPKNKKNRLATVYSTTVNGVKKAANPGKAIGQGHYVNGPRVCFSGGAGLVSTAIDYAKFLQMMLNKGTFNGKQIISRKTAELMTIDHIEDRMYINEKGVGFGLGFNIVKNVGYRGKLGSKGEFGWGGAYHSKYWVDPKEELVVCYFTQLIPARNIDDHKKLRNLIYQAIK